MSQPPPMGAPMTLDDPQTLTLDSLGMLDAIAGSAEALDRGRAAAEALEIFFPASAVREVAICGMGGSAVAGDLVLGAYRQRLRHPAEVVRDYYLPGWVGEDTLCILSSYSGETEETLTCAMQATERNALCVAITSGGKLGGQYREMGVPVVDLPAGLQPRAALIHLLTPLAVILSRMEVIGDIAADLDEARGVLQRAVAACRPEVPQSTNAAKQLAAFLIDSLPLVWGADLTAAAAMRWKCQFNENAKMPAFWATLPELDHNEIVGFEDTGPLGPLTHVVELREPRHHRQIERRFDLTRELIEPRVRHVTAITAEGESPLARMLDLVMLGDYVSLYLALLRGHDPGPVELIGKLKERLATTGYGRSRGAE